MRQHGFLSRRDIDELLFNKLSESLIDQQKKYKINNIISEMRRTNTIRNIGTFNAPKWVLIE